jgi:hypothetical protein
MSRAIRLLATIALVVLVAAVGGSPAHGRSVSRIHFLIGAKRLGGLSVTPSSPSDRLAVRYFARHGEGGSTSRTNDFCYLRFAEIGLLITLSNRRPGKATLANCKFFEADVTGPRWHTANGLRLGVSAATMIRLFPQARKIGRVGGVIGARLHHPTAWWLAHWKAPTEEARTILAAYVRRGHVVALGVSVVGH